MDVSAGTVTAGGAAAGQTARNNKKPTPTEIQLKGVVSGLTGTADAFEFFVKGRRIAGSATTTFKGGTSPSFARLVEGANVHVHGTDKGAYVAAARIILQDTDEDGDDGAAEVEVNGVVGAMTGTAPDLTLTVGDTTVRTTSATLVRIKSKTVALADLRVGQSLEVTGTLDGEGTLIARRIQIKAAAPAPAPKPFDAKGLVTAVDGTCPAITFTFEGKTVTTSPSTQYVQLTCGKIAAGTKVRVKGTATDGSVAATWIKKEK